MLSGFPNILLIIIPNIIPKTGPPIIGTKEPSQVAIDASIRVNNKPGPVCL